MVTLLTPSLPCRCDPTPIMSPTPLITSSASLMDCDARPGRTTVAGGSRHQRGDPPAPHCRHTSSRSWMRYRQASGQPRWKHGPPLSMRERSRCW